MHHKSEFIAKNKPRITINVKTQSVMHKKIYIDADAYVSIETKYLNLFLKVKNEEKNQRKTTKQTMSNNRYVLNQIYRHSVSREIYS